MEFGLPRATLELAHAEYSCSLRMLDLAMQADGRRRAATPIMIVYLGRFDTMVQVYDCAPKPVIGPL